MKLEVLGPGPKILDLKPLGWYMERHLANVQQNGEFYVVVALSETGALRLLSKNIRRISRQNGKVKAIIGIDLGTSENFLDEITNIFGIGNVFVYHNPKASTFHPKMYIIKVDENLGVIIVGSSNLTSGGLFKNFELNLAVELDLQKTEERKLFQRFSSLFEKANKLGFESSNKATYICIEGPGFSTKAESNMFRQFADIIGMTLVPEVKLARELEICYASISMVTDYDVWKERDEVSADKVKETMAKNIAKVRKLLLEVILEIPENRNCVCSRALEDAQI